MCGAAGVGGDVSGCGAVECGEVEYDGGGVGGNAGTTGDLQFGDCSLTGAGGAGVEESGGGGGGEVAAGGVPAVDVGDEVGGRGGVEADLAAGADGDGGGVGDRGAAGCVVEVGDVGQCGAAGVGGDVSGCGAVECGEVEYDGGGVGGNAGTTRDLQFGHRTGTCQRLAGRRWRGHGELYDGGESGCRCDGKGGATDDGIHG